MKVDVVIPTRRREEIRPELLEVIKNEASVGQLIITEEKPLSIARKNACLRAKTEWVAMFDDDIIIPPNWFEKVFKHIDEKVGAISTVADTVNPYFQAYQTVVSRIFPLKSIDTAPHINNVLIRRSLMENYTPPPLFLSEDFFLKRHVESQGYVWKVVDRIGVIHTGKRSSSLRVAIAYRRYGHYKFHQLLRRFVARLLLAPFAALSILSIKALFELWQDNVEFFAGWLKG
ncbi:glycosyltransferase [Candidatus Bathyarchaeota archaeon]|nr:glycosyltransferase [Candidatus Bathyarchaeota archaeon]